MACQGAVPRTTACMLPLPLAGEGLGVGRCINEVKAFALASAGPLPRPLSRKRERGANQRSG
ncbi:hypothetical protein CBM2592_B140048 [Cupriavidus taiwanensis]|nr:hypothetical protein CBM2588_B180049 [Cupriavidus taiwanensis]SOY66694.1 hypothetical protein CBM2592_B140048 [Cupriavidus taiwanensis]SPA51802.1 hypothetical protein CBM2629_B130071 [Cupriavidus taiwanensis]